MAEQSKLSKFMRKGREKDHEVFEAAVEGPYELPKGWKWVKLGDVCEIIMGQSPSSSTYNEKEIGLPFLQGKAEFGEIYPEPEKWCSDPIKIAEPNDVLVSVRAPVGPTNLCKEEYCIGRGLAALRVNQNKLLDRFLLYVLRYLEPKIAQIGKGSTFNGIREENLTAFTIPFPPFKEQRRIVARIEKFNNKIEKAKKLKKVSKERSEMVMQAASHKVFSRAEEKDWEKVKLGNISEISAGGTPKRSVKKYYGGNIPWVKISDIPDNGMVYETEERLTKHGLENSSAKVFPKGTILFTIFATIGKVGVLKIDAATNQAIAGIQIKNIGTVNRNYLFYCLRNIGTSLVKVGRGIAQNNINQTILKNVEIPLPSVEEQRKISTYLDNVRRNIESLRTLQGKTDEDTKGLVPAILNKAFRGELLCA